MRLLLLLASAAAISKVPKAPTAGRKAAQAQATQAKPLALTGGAKQKQAVQPLAKSDAEMDSKMVRSFMSCMCRDMCHCVLVFLFVVPFDVHIVHRGSNARIQASSPRGHHVLGCMQAEVQAYTEELRRTDILRFVRDELVNFDTEGCTSEVEIPMLPMTPRGVLFDRISAELVPIADEFLAIRNLSPQAEALIASTGDLIKTIKKAEPEQRLDEAGEVDQLARLDHLDLRQDQAAVPPGRVALDELAELRLDLCSRGGDAERVARAVATSAQRV